ncbi:MAG: polysaccharide biosynthesis tyrosine autokinase [Deltaproteobacteria bacterium]|nr:polysaccharide biosynthesis tyrosine autokinase [Deltaproteobacteria bacterium]
MQPQRFFTRRAEMPLAASDIETEARPMFIDQAEPLIDLSRYYRLVRKRQRIVIAFAAAVMIIGVVHIISTPPTYIAETTIMLAPATGEGSSTLENLVEIETAAYNADQYYKTQSEILESPVIAAYVIRRLGLVHRPAFIDEPTKDSFARLWSNLIGLLTGSAKTKPRTPSFVPGQEDGISRALADRYMAMLKVTLVPGTNLLKISFATHDPRLSAELAKAHVEGYEQQQSQIRSGQSEEARLFLENKLIEIKEQLQNSEAALNDYRRRKGIIPGLISLDGKNAVVLDRLADLSRNLTTAQVDRIGLEAQVAIIRKHDYISLPAVAQSVEIQTLRKEINDLYVQEAALSTQFRPDYPPLAKLRLQIDEVQRQLGIAIDKVVAEARSSYDAAVEKENELQAEINRQRTETLNLNDAAAQYAILQREVDTNRELYNAVLTRMKDVAVTSGERLNNVSVIVPAEIPTGPTTPKKARELILALILGVSGGIALAFALDFLDNTLKNPEEAEIYLRAPILGTVPEFSALAGRSSGYGVPELPTGRSAAPAAGRELVTAYGSYSAIGECYRNFRTALLLSRAEHPPRTTLITSAISREGKTVTSVNTAVMLAQLGAKTVLVDADLRRARCHRLLSIENHLGLTEVLTGSRELHEVLRPTEIEHLNFVSSGATAPNPTELLGSHKMAETLRHLEQEYEYIVIDSSPVLPVSDSLLLAKLVDGVVIVANAAATPRQQVQIACVRVEYARGRLLGIVLNRIKLHSPDYHPYYGGYYYTVQNGQGGGQPH